MRRLAALLGLSVLAHACAGRSERVVGNNGPDDSVGAGATGGTQGAGGSTQGTGGTTQGTGGTSQGTGATGGTQGTGDDGFGATGGTAPAAGGTGAQGGAAGRRGGGGVAGRAGSGGRGAGGAAAGAGPRRECRNPTQYSSNLIRCDGDYVHRPSAGTCTLSPRLAVGGAGAPGGGGFANDLNECDVDADCTDHHDGYCVWIQQLGFQRSSSCVYACRTDAECEAGNICVCDDQQHRAWSGTPLSIGRCVPSTCLIDASCGPGSQCVAPILEACAGSPQVPSAFACQSPADECNGPGDCAAGSEGGAPAGYECYFGDGEQHFVCDGPLDCKKVRR